MNLTNQSTFADLVYGLIGIINMLIPLLFGVTLLVLLWKIVDSFIIHGGESAKVEEGKKVVFVGVLSLVVMSGIWGILAILRSSIF